MSLLAALVRALLLPLRLLSQALHEAIEFVRSCALESEQHYRARRAFWRGVCCWGIPLAWGSNFVVFKIILESARDDKELIGYGLGAAALSWTLGLALLWLAQTVRPRTYQERFGSGYLTHVVGLIEIGRAVVSFRAGAVLSFIAALIIQAWSFRQALL